MRPAYVQADAAPIRGTGKCWQGLQESFEQATIRWEPIARTMLISKHPKQEYFLIAEIQAILTFECTRGLQPSVASQIKQSVGVEISWHDREFFKGVRKLHRGFLVKATIAIAFQNRKIRMVVRRSEVPDDEVCVAVGCEVARSKRPCTVVGARMVIHRLLESTIAISQKHRDLPLPE